MCQVGRIIRGKPGGRIIRGTGTTNTVFGSLNLNSPLRTNILLQPRCYKPLKTITIK